MAELNFKIYHQKRQKAFVKQLSEFSGLIFKLDGATELLSWIAVCRWSMEGYGTTANLNELPLKLQQEGVMLPHEAESFFEFSANHMLTTWGILISFVVVFLIAARLMLNNIDKE